MGWILQPLHVLAGFSWPCWPLDRPCASSHQVTLSYGMFENKRNSIHMKGAFSVEEDPSR